MDTWVVFLIIGFFVFLVVVFSSESESLPKAIIASLIIFFLAYNALQKSADDSRAISEAYDRGYEDGYEQGYEDGYDANPDH